MHGNYLLVGDEFKAHIPWIWAAARDRPPGIISIGWVAAPAGMSIDDFEVVEFLQFNKREGDPFTTRDANGNTKTEHMVGTVMRTEFTGKVIVPPRHPGGTVTILPMCEIPAFRLEAAECSPCDRITRDSETLSDTTWTALDGLPWQATNMETRPGLADPDAYSADGDSLIKSQPALALQQPVVSPKPLAPAQPGQPAKPPASEQVDTQDPQRHDGYNLLLRLYDEGEELDIADLRSMCVAYGSWDSLADQLEKMSATGGKEKSSCGDGAQCV